MIDRFVAFGASAPSRNILRASVAALAVTAALPMPAFAQTTPAAPAPAPVPADANTIVVTGYAHSIQNANRIKKLDTGVTEVISAEDIGKLPDVSITDALSRLPGLAVQEAAGRAKYISIRGFGPDYTTATLNGRVIATVDDNRRFDYGQYPGDLFQQIDVIKTPSADLLNQGLAGTVNLQTYDPLTQKNALAINVQGEANQYGKLNPESPTAGYKVSTLYTHKFADNTIGVSLGFSAIQDTTQDYHWATGGGNGNYYGPGNTNDPLGAITPDDIQNYVNSNTLYRQSGFGHVVYKPNDKFEMSVDALYTQTKTREYSRGWEMPLAHGWSNDTEVPGSEQVSNGYVTSAQWNVNPVLRNDYNTSNGETFAIGGNFKYHFSDDIKLVVDADYSRAHRHDNTYEIYGGLGNNQKGTALATITRQADGSYGVNIAGVNFADPNQVSLTDPQGWNQVGFNNIPDLHDTVKGFKAELDGNIHSGFFKSWEVGVNYSDETKVSAYSGYYICLPGAASVAGCGADNAQVTSVAIPSSIIDGSVEPYGVTGTNLLAINPLGAQGLLRTSEQSVASNDPRDWRVEEKILTGYLQANFDTIAGSLPVRGNIGTQIVNTDQSSTGYLPVAGSTTQSTPESGGAKYTYVLPSANLSIEVDHDMVVRLGASRTLARATLDDENASYGVSSCGTTTKNSVTTANGCTTAPLYNGQQTVLLASGGNPALRPYFSDNVDLSIEKYFAHDQGKIAIAGYYKAISNFTTQNSKLNSGNVNSDGPTSYTTTSFENGDCSGYVSLLNGATLNANQTLSCWYSQPTNAGRGSVLGFEVSAVLPLKVLTPALDGFSVIGNWAHTTSEIRFSNGTQITLPGLSKDVVQAQVFFEKYGFNARASYTHRSAFLGDYQLFNAQVEQNFTNPLSTLDAQIGYEFKGGALKGLSLYIQGHNLTNAVQTSYVNNDPKETNIRDQYGAQYLFGATFKF